MYHFTEKYALQHKKQQDCYVCIHKFANADTYVTNYAVQALHLSMRRKTWQRYIGQYNGL